MGGEWILGTSAKYVLPRRSSPSLEPDTARLHSRPHGELPSCRHVGVWGGQLPTSPRDAGRRCDGAGRHRHCDPGVIGAISASAQHRRSSDSSCSRRFRTTPIRRQDAGRGQVAHVVTPPRCSRSTSGLPAPASGSLPAIPRRLSRRGPFVPCSGGVPELPALMPLRSFPLIVLLAFPGGALTVAAIQLSGKSAPPVRRRVTFVASSW